MSLQSAADHYRAQQRLIAVALAASRRAWSIRNIVAFARTLAALMERSALNGSDSVAQIVAEQGLEAPPEARLAPSALSRSTSDGRSLTGLLEQAATSAGLDLMAVTQVADAGRVAQGIETVIRPKLSGHVRYLNPPSCARCTILAGRFYRWSTGFLRHPHCDCVMIPTTEKAAHGLIGNPHEAFDRGLVRGLSKADTRAIEDGADMARVVNVRLKKAGLTIAGRVQDRAGKPTPEAIYRLASDREEAIRLLRKFGYIF